MRKVLFVLCGCLVLATAFAVAQPYMGLNNKPAAGQTKVASSAQDFNDAVNASSKQYLDQINQKIADQFKAAQAAQAAAQAQAQAQTQTQQPPANTSGSSTTTVTTSPTQPSSSLPRPITTPTTPAVAPNYSISNTAPATMPGNKPVQNTNGSVYTGFGTGSGATVTTPPGQTNSNSGSNWNIKY